MADYRAKKAALSARLKQLDKDEQRIAEKRQVTEKQLVGLSDKQDGEEKPAKRGRRGG